MRPRAVALGLGVVAMLFSATLLRGASLPPSHPMPRYGVVVVREMGADQLDRLGPVWYYRYGYESDGLRGHQRVFLVGPHFDGEAVRMAITRHPGAWWLVGNEPNDPFQDNLSPAAYAAFYQRFTELALSTDRSCRLVPAGLANADWRWAQAFVDSYVAQYGRAPTIAAWNIHNYILEPDRDQLDLQEFKERILSFRRWMAQVGDGDKPLLLTEFGVLFGTGLAGRPAEEPERVKVFVHEAVRWLAETDHVQCWAWFATNTGGQFNGDLYLDNGELSSFGILYRDALLIVAGS